MVGFVKETRVASGNGGGGGGGGSSVMTSEGGAAAAARMAGGASKLEAADDRFAGEAPLLGAHERDEDDTVLGGTGSDLLVDTDTDLFDVFGESIEMVPTTSKVKKKTAAGGYSQL